MSTLDDAIQAIRMGDREEGRQILEEILEVDESNEDVWLWLSSVVDTDEDREICLENVLALDPDNTVAQKGLEALRSGTFNVHSIMGEALEEREATAPESTFIEEFEVEADEFEDDDLVMPSTMAGEAEAKGGLMGSLNIRLIILVGLIFVVIILALGGVAASLLLGGGDGDAGTPGEQTTQEGPAGGDGEQTSPETAETETPTPSPTPTATPTEMPLELPTPLPTDPPTPTATPVVAPTPAGGGG